MNSLAFSYFRVYSSVSLRLCKVSNQTGQKLCVCASSVNHRYMVLYKVINQITSFCSVLIVIHCLIKISSHVLKFLTFWGQVVYLDSHTTRHDGSWKNPPELQVATARFSQRIKFHGHIQHDEVLLDYAALKDVIDELQAVKFIALQPHTRQAWNANVV